MYHMIIFYRKSPMATSLVNHEKFTLFGNENVTFSLIKLKIIRIKNSLIPLLDYLS